MKIKVTDKSSESGRVKVNVVTKISLKKLIEDMDLFDKLIEYHYNVNSEYRDISDLTSDEIIYYIEELLCDYYDKDYDKAAEYTELAKEALAEIANKLIDTIYDRDDNATELAKERDEAFRGEY